MAGRTGMHKPTLTAAQSQACQRLYTDWRRGNEAGRREPTREQAIAIRAYRQALRAVGRKPASLLMEVVLLGRPHAKVAASLRCQTSDVSKAMQVVAEMLVAHYTNVDRVAAA